MKYVTVINEKEYEVEIIDEKHVRINGKMMEVDFHAVSGQPVYSMLIGGKSYEAYVYPDEKDWQVLLHGHLYQASVEDERERRLRAAAGSGVAQDSEYHMKAPMPGMVVAVPVSEGQQIKKGDVLVILESMKMQNELRSPRDGIIQRIKVKAGESVEQRAALLSVV